MKPFSSAGWVIWILKEKPPQLQRPPGLTRWKQNEHKWLTKPCIEHKPPFFSVASHRWYIIEMHTIETYVIILTIIIPVNKQNKTKQQNKWQKARIDRRNNDAAAKWSHSTFTAYVAWNKAYRDFHWLSPEYMKDVTTAWGINQHPEWVRVRIRNVLSKGNWEVKEHSVDRLKSIEFLPHFRAYFL